MRRAWTTSALALVAAALLSGCGTAAAPSPTPPSSESAAGASATPTDAAATPVAGSFAPTPSPTPSSYAELGEFGRWAQTLDRLYGLEPDFQDWNDAADANCELQREGDVESMYVPDSAAGLAEGTAAGGGGAAAHPVAGRIWAASVLTRCPDLLDTPPVRTQTDVKLAGLDWVDPDWLRRLTPS